MEIELEQDSPVVNITIVSYLVFPMAFISSLQFAAPALDMGGHLLRKRYNFNVTQRYVGSYNWSSIQGMVDNVYLVPKFYYKEWDRNGLFALVSPGMDETFGEAALAREWNTPIVTATITDEAFRDKKRYPSVISLTPISSVAYVEAIEAVLNYFSWTSIYIVQDEAGPSPFFQFWIGAAKVYFTARKTKLLLRTATGNTAKNGTGWFRNVLQDASKYSRVIFISMNGYRVREFMIAASLAGMTNGEYVYFGFVPYEVPRLVGIMTFEKPGDDEGNQIAAEAFRSLMVFSSCKYTEKSSAIYQRREQIVSEFMRRSLDDYNFTYPTGEKPSEFIMATYNGVEILGQLINESLANNIPLSGASLGKAALNRTFELDAGSVVLDKYGERMLNQCISDFDVVTKQFKQVLLHSGVTKKLLNISGTPIDWANKANTAPPNEPICGYLYNRAICAESDNNQQQWIGITMAVLFIFAIGIGVVIYRKEIHHKRLVVQEYYLENDKLKWGKGKSLSRSRATSIRAH